MRVFIDEIARHVDQEVELRGWLYQRRSKGKIHFLILRDGTGFLQATVVQGRCRKRSSGKRTTSPRKPP